MCSDTEYSFQIGRGILNGSSPVQKFIEGNNLGSNYLEEQRSLILHKFIQYAMHAQLVLYVINMVLKLSLAIGVMLMMLGLPP